MSTIVKLPLDPEDRVALIRAAKDEFAETCLRMDWRDAIKARENWNPETFVDKVLLFGVPLPIRLEDVFRLISTAMTPHINEDLILPEQEHLH
jgi:hypothetical protein